MSTVTRAAPKVFGRLSPTTREALGRLAVALGLALALAYTTTDLMLSAPNERSRLYLTVAMFEGHTFYIDEVRARLGPIVDEATYGGHVLTDKAPGASFLALLPYAVMRLFVGAHEVNLARLLDLGRYFVMVPIGVASFFVFEALCARLAVERRVTRFCSLAYLLATPAFHYSAAFFGHQIVALALMLAVWLSLRAQANSSRVTWLLSGVAAGIAGLTEYQAFLGILALGAFVMATARDRADAWGRASCFVLGGLPFAILLGYYHASCFGGPFELSYHHLSHPALAKLHRQGLGGVSAPTVDALVGCLFSLHRGLFSTSPFLLLAPFGFWGLWRRGHVALSLFLGLTSVLFIGFVAASATWEAGWGYGCRLLIPIVPFLGLLVAVALDRAAGAGWRWGFAVSGLLVALASFQMVTALFAEPPNELKNPWLDVVWPLGAESLVTQNLGMIGLGLRGWMSLLPLGLVLVGLVAPMLVGLGRVVRGRRWLLWVPVLPLLWALFVGWQGPSRTQDHFDTFVRSLRPLSRE